LADDDVRRQMWTLSADVQAALALNRAALQAVAAMSLQTSLAADEALGQEAADARGLASPQRVLDVIEDLRVRLNEQAWEDERMSSLELALIAAADALPDFDLDTAEARLSTR
jgi:hypothetical protein